ncbi:hypothetical protein [Vallitalea guaymasensis]|nr:hypothetical protein [Vallitalea guaymasensis]
MKKITNKRQIIIARKLRLLKHYMIVTSLGNHVCYSMINDILHEIKDV